jgi:hypothetical protein
LTIDQETLTFLSLLLSFRRIRPLVLITADPQVLPRSLLFIG